jgi:hypothetical protein
MPDGEEQLPISDADLLAIHNATSVVVGGETLDIAVGAAGCRFVRVGDRTSSNRTKKRY